MVVSNILMLYCYISCAGFHEATFFSLIYNFNSYDTNVIPTFLTKHCRALICILYVLFFF